MNYAIRISQVLHHNSRVGVFVFKGGMGEKAEMSTKCLNTFYADIFTSPVSESVKIKKKDFVTWRLDCESSPALPRRLENDSSSASDDDDDDDVG